MKLRFTRINWALVAVGVQRTESVGMTASMSRASGSGTPVQCRHVRLPFPGKEGRVQADELRELHAELAERGASLDAARSAHAAAECAAGRALS